MNYITPSLHYKQDRQEENKSLVTLCVAPAFPFFDFSSSLLTIRYIPAAQTGRDLLPSGHRSPLHSRRAAPGSTEVTVQQRWRVPGRRQGDQPQVARADIRHWRADAFSVYAVPSPGEI